MALHAPECVSDPAAAPARSQPGQGVALCIPRPLRHRRPGRPAPQPLRPLGYAVGNEAGNATAMGNATGDPIIGFDTTPAENIGRFCPIDGSDFRQPPNVPVPDDFAIAPPGTIHAAWRYHFAT